MNSIDIMDGLANIRHVFISAGLEPPTTILLGTHDEGMKLLSSIRQTGNWQAIAGSPQLGKPIEMADGSVWMEIKVMDFAIRWPANKYVTHDGSWIFA